MSKDFVMGTIHHFNWVQIGGAITHPDEGKCIDLDQDTAEKTGVPGANLKLYPCNGYGSPQLVRQVLNLHPGIEGIMIYTDPRFWEWLFNMEHEIRSHLPIMYYNIWDDLPYPVWNQKYYDSVDSLFNITKQTVNIVKNVRSSYEDWQVTYIPHGISETEYFPIPNDVSMDTKVQRQMEELREQMFKGEEKDFVIFYNARNIRRKLPADIVYAYRTFCDSIPPEDAKKCALLMHCEPTDNNGTDLPEVVRQIGNGHDVVFSTSKFERDVMNVLYNIADVGILISSNEGFGLSGAENLITGTPIIINVSGGMQDYCGFKKEDGSYLTVDDYTTEWGSNHDGRYKDHGEWVFPVWPTSRSIQGSIPTPYIADDRPDWQDVAIQMKKAWKERGEKLKARGQAGRDYVLNPEFGFTANEMSRRFTHDILQTIKNFKPLPRMTITNGTEWRRKVIKNNGLTMTKEI
jgi:glycosyltransferase involved in cell wall biosynthesis